MDVSCMMSSPVCYPLPEAFAATHGPASAAAAAAAAASALGYPGSHAHHHSGPGHHGNMGYGNGPGRGMGRDSAFMGASTQHGLMGACGPVLLASNLPEQVS